MYTEVVSLFPSASPHLYHFKYEISLNLFKLLDILLLRDLGCRSFFKSTEAFHAFFNLFTNPMISSTHNHLNIVKDAFPSTVAQYNDGNRRAVSAQHGNQNLDSSESTPSEHSSIYEAAVASFESFGAGCVEQLNDHGTDAPGNDSSSSNNVGTHGTCRLTTLETITEQRSASLFGSPISPSGAKPGGPTSASTLSQSSFSGPRRRGAFSLDDIDAQIIRRKLREKHDHAEYSSSSDTFEQNVPLSQRQSPVDPAQPILPPPARTPTPPGLPSFGSPEAMRFRNASQPSHGRRSSSRSSQPPPPGPSQGTADTGVGNNGNGASGSRGGSLRRLLRSWAEPQPVSLAPGIVGRAEDGTLVRARFCTRQSGHGIGAGPGSRGLEAHPFHRNTLPVARTNEVVQVDGSPHSSRDEGQLSQPEAFAPPRHVRASSSSSHTSLPYPNAQSLPQFKPSSKNNPRVLSHAGSSAAAASHVTYRNSEQRLPRIIEMTTFSRPDNQARTPGGPDSGAQGDNTTPSSQPGSKKIKTYWTQFYEMCSSFCCRAMDEEETIEVAARSRQVDGSGDIPGNIARNRDGSSPAMGRNASLNSRASNALHSPWIPAWGCQPGRTMGMDGASEDG